MINETKKHTHAHPQINGKMTQQVLIMQVLNFKPLVLRCHEAPAFGPLNIALF